MAQPDRGGRAAIDAIAYPEMEAFWNDLAEDRELFDQHRRLDGVEPGVHADAHLVVFVAALAMHSWPDNVRGLEGVAKKLAIEAGPGARSGTHDWIKNFLVDSPDFTHRVARRVRRFAPQIPILDYVSPSVWAWRAGRARAMRRYVDHVLAILPFEPAAHRRLGGPPCSYVGHPLVERIADLRPSPDEARRRLAEPPIILALPGSRSGEIRRLAATFGAALERLAARIGPIEVVVPTVANVAPQLREAVAGWAVRPRVVVEPAEKWAAFRNARAALAASGTVTLELALSGVPMVAAYRLDFIEAVIARAIRLQARLPSVILANLVIGENVVPELLQEDCTPDKLADALLPVVRDTEQRRRQVEAFRRLDEIMIIGGPPPSAKAAAIVLKAARMGRSGVSALIEAPSPG